jgi:hypothetical protein
MLFIAAISLWSFLLLVKTRLVVPGSFGGKPFCATVALAETDSYFQISAAYCTDVGCGLSF